MKTVYVDPSFTQWIEAQLTPVGAILALAWGAAMLFYWLGNR